MADQNVQLIAFNRGLISKYALARIDLQRMRMSAEVMTNWMPRVYGAMMLRAGLGYTGLGPTANLFSKNIPFIRSTTDVSRVELVNNSVRIIVNDEFVTFPGVAAAVTNGSFISDLSGWTDEDTGAAVSQWSAPNYMSLMGDGTNAAVRTQEVTTASPNVEHALFITIPFGTVRLRIGSTDDTDDLVNERPLEGGMHVVAFTPTTTSFYIYLANSSATASFVGSINILPPGPLGIPSPWTTAQIPFVRYDQSADVMYLCDGVNAQQKLERYAPHSWSLVTYAPTDGPFLTINTSPITLTASAISGDITLTASGNVFRPGHVNALFRLASASQIIQASLASATFTNPIRTSGVGSAREITISLTGTFVGTLTLQRSVGLPGNWTNVKTYTAQIIDDYIDGLDNQIVYYRVGFTTYTSGTCNVALSFNGGSIFGICRITKVNSPTSADASTFLPFGDTNPTTLWYEGAWSVYRGYPSTVQLHEGRLWWHGIGTYFGSVSDGYDSFDDTIVGDSGPIISAIGFGPVDTIDWSLSLQRLLVGTDSAVISAWSDAVLDPITPTNFNLKSPINYGSSRVAAAKVDFNGYFVERSGVRLYELTWTASYYNPIDYTAADMTAVCFEVCQPGIAQIAVQRQPDTRLHCRLTDGSVAILILDKLEQVQCWFKLQTAGIVEDIFVLPGVTGSYEEQVYYTVNRTINGVQQRYYEKFSLETECRGATLNKQADSFVIYDGAPTNVMAAIAPHLAGQQVIVWADGIDYSPRNPDDNSQKTYLVANDGSVTMDAGVTVSNAVVGLSYTASFRSVKMAYAAQQGSALTRRKRIGTMAPILADTHYQGLQYGHSLDDMLDELPLVEYGIETPPNTVWDTFDRDDFSFNGEWGPDERLCLQAMAPRPCNIMGVIVSLETEG